VNLANQKNLGNHKNQHHMNRENPNRHHQLMNMVAKVKANR
jgi:hypothetical protein